MRYKFIEGLTVADVAFEAYGHNLNELFENAALATMDVMVKLDTVKATTKRSIHLKNENVSSLLFKFIEEIIFLKDAKYIVFGRFKVKITKKYELDAVAYGETINPKKHLLRVDVKAVTMHHFEVKEVKGRWKARMVLDI